MIIAEESEWEDFEEGFEGAGEAGDEEREADGEVVSEKLLEDVIRDTNGMGILLASIMDSRFMLVCRIHYSWKPQSSLKLLICSSQLSIRRTA